MAVNAEEEQIVEFESSYPMGRLHRALERRTIMLEDDASRMRSLSAWCGSAAMSCCRTTSPSLVRPAALTNSETTLGRGEP